MQVLVQNAQSYIETLTKIRRYLEICDSAEQFRGSSAPELVRRVVRRWARETLRLLSIEVSSIVGTPSPGPVLFVGNHLSYVDIPLLLSLTDTSFVAKKEVGSWPLIGRAANRIETVYVQRNSKSSRGNVTEAIYRHISLGKSVALFPSGTTSIDCSKPWRWGAFRAAKDNDLLIQPFRLSYSPVEQVAFVGKDSFIPHLWRLVRGSKVQATVEFHSPVKVTNVEKDCTHWQTWAAKPRKLDSTLKRVDI